jgi:hypothetical protein
MNDMHYKELPPADIAALRGAFSSKDYDTLGELLVSCALARADDDAVFEMAVACLHAPNEKTVALAIEALQHLYWFGRYNIATLDRVNEALRLIPNELRSSRFIRENLGVLCEYLTEAASRDGLSISYSTSDDWLIIGTNRSV